MVIDFHTHIFPDKIASRTINLLVEKGGHPPFSDGTRAGLLQRMEKVGVDVAVNHPVMTSPSQFESINRFAAELNQSYSGNGPRLISFAGIHPACENLMGKMRQIKNQGFLGVKIHPDYQGTMINDERYLQILQCAAEYDLIVITHAGLDPASPNCIHCPPLLVKELIRKVPKAKFVLAHMGGNAMWEEALDVLCDEDVYFDAATPSPILDEDLFKRLLSRRGADRILFASDSPWGDMQRDVDRIRSFSLGKDAEDKIFFSNAKKLLRI